MNRNSEPEKEPDDEPEGMDDDLWCLRAQEKSL